MLSDYFRPTEVRTRETDPGQMEQTENWSRIDLFTHSRRQKDTEKGPEKTGCSRGSQMPSERLATKTPTRMSALPA